MIVMMIALRVLLSFWILVRTVHAQVETLAPHHERLPSNVERFVPLAIRGGSTPFRTAPRTMVDPFSKRSSGRKTFPQKADYSVQDDNDDQESTTTSTDDKESVKEMIDAFLTRDSRNTFIARVYAILSGQLIFTAIVCILFGTLDPLTSISQINTSTGYYTNPLVMVPLGGILLSTVAWFRMAAHPEARQKSPDKWWWMAAFTFGEAVSLGCLSSLFKLQSVLLAMGATTIATITVSAYTILQRNAKYDLSQWGATLSSWAMALLVFLVVGLAQELNWLPFKLIPYTDMAYSLFATFLFSLFLAHHTKLIVGGKHSKYRMNEKDYVFGAMALYVDIINIFLNILQLIGEDRK
jgi:protein lifeguard